MGVFDGFQGTQVQLSPEIALAAGMLYVSAADGHLSSDEKAALLRVVPRDDVLGKALDYIKQTPMTQFLQAAPGVLTPAQRLCMILNMADAAMGDGTLGPNERTLLNQFQAAFQIPDATIAPYVQTLMIKNNLSVFNF